MIEINLKDFIGTSNQKLKNLIALSNSSDDDEYLVSLIKDYISNLLVKNRHHMRLCDNAYYKAFDGRCMKCGGEWLLTHSGLCLFHSKNLLTRKCPYMRK